MQKFIRFRWKLTEKSISEVDYFFIAFLPMSPLCHSAMWVYRRLSRFSLANMFSTPAETLLFPCENMITWKKDDQREENGKAKVSSYPASVSNEKHRKFYASCVNPPPCIPNLLSINPIAFSRKKLKTHFLVLLHFCFWLSTTQCHSCIHLLKIVKCVRF